MALNNAAILDVAFAAGSHGEALRRDSENVLMHAYSGFVLLFMHNQSVPSASLRQMIKGHAMNTGAIAWNTIESYMKGIEVSARSLRTNLASDRDFLAIFNMSAEDAVDAVRERFEALNVVSGSDIRLWSKQPGFEALDKAAIKAAAKAEAAAKAQEKVQGALATFLRMNGDAGLPSAAPVPAPAPVIEADPLDAAARAIDALRTEAELLSILDTLNGRLAALRAKPTVAPVTADDAVADARSTLARHFNRAA